MKKKINYGIGPLKHFLEMKLSGFKGDDFCKACGFVGRKKIKAVMWPGLIEEWELSPEWANWYNEREGRYCVACRSSARTDQLAGVLLSALERLAGIYAQHLKGACSMQNLSQLKVAEINSAGTIHQFLEKLPGLYYSEYASAVPEIRSEDLSRLSYVNAFFDLVITSETLEHVPDVDRALSEIHRVLRPGGLHVFTIPVVWDRNLTRTRARLTQSGIEHILPPSYHGAPNDNHNDYLVFNEFGADVVARIEKAGFKATVIRDPENPALACFLTVKTGDESMVEKSL